MGSYEVPRVDVNKTGWGPTQLPEQYMDIPYAPFNRNDKLGKVADFVSTYNNRSGRYVRDPSGVNADFQYRHDTVEDASFQLVDTAKTTRHRTIDRIRPTWNQQRFGARYSQNHRGRGAPPAEVRGTHQTGQLQMKGQQKHNKRWDRFNNARRAYTSRRRDDVKTDRLATVRIQADWRLVDEFDLQQLTKLQANIPTAEDIRFCGSLLEYDTNFDRMTSKSSKRLSRYDDREFFYVTTNADPVIEELAMEKEATVFATDAILAHLMACTRSVLPWDIVVHKVNNMIFFDKRDQSTFDFLTVNENAAESPSSDDRDSINHPDRLSLEATMINQNFSQSLMKTDSSFVKTFEHPNPFADEETKPAAIAYRYRKLDLGTETLIVRCEINGVSRKRGKEEYISTYALNEWDPKVSGNVEWRTKIDTQRGAILATELKNNFCKLYKWTAQALLSGVDEMKLGFISRVNYKDPLAHVILGIQSYRPDIFATQIALSQNNMWGIIKMLIQVFSEEPEGKYVIMKDPNRPVLRIYAVPFETFEDDPDDNDEDSDM